MRFTTIATLFGAATLATAQQQYTIDPSNVQLSMRTEWCNNQEASCPLICLQMPDNDGALHNDCDRDLLQYSCVCTNGISPNLTEYTQTLPYFICTEWGNECVSNCGSNNLCAADCREKHPCGAQPPKKNITSFSTTASKTSTQTTTQKTAKPTGFIESPLDAYNNGASPALHLAALEFGQGLGMAVMIASLFGGLAIML